MINNFALEQNKYYMCVLFFLTCAPPKLNVFVCPQKRGPEIL